METEDCFFNEKNFLWHKLEKEFFDSYYLEDSLKKLEKKILNQELLDIEIDNDIVSEQKLEILEKSNFIIFQNNSDFYLL